MAEIVAMEGTWQEKRLHYGLNEQIFGANEQNRPRDQSDHLVAPPYDVACSHNAERADPGQPRIPVWPGSLPWQRRTNLWRERTNLRTRAAAPRTPSL